MNKVPTNFFNKSLYCGSNLTSDTFIKEIKYYFANKSKLYSYNCHLKNQLLRFLRYNYSNINHNGIINCPVKET